MEREAGHRPVILVVDDDEASLQVLGALFLGLGYVVEYATDGLEAMAAARRNVPDIAVTDILMPRQDGFSLCMDWVRDPKLCTVPLVFYTATYTDDRDRRFGLSLGAADFLIKPMDPDLLAEKVRELLERPHLPRLPFSEGWEAWVLRRYNDVLARKLEQKMRELEELGGALGAGGDSGDPGDGPFRFLSQRSGEAVVVVRGSRVVHANPAALALLGRGPDRGCEGLDAGALRAPGPPSAGPLRRRWPVVGAEPVEVEIMESPCRFEGEDAVLLVAHAVAPGGQGPI